MRCVISALAVAFLFAASHESMAQTSSPAPTADQSQLLKPEQLDALVAPIALYPDTLLSEVLMASTYPLEVVEAERWLNANKELKGDELKAAVDKEPWDDSVKSLLATPSVLDMMSSRIGWTQKLGKAVVDQQADVMDAVQRLRAKAQANDKLKPTKQQDVVVRQEQGRPIIAIEPTDPNTVYVPYYDPGVVYGEWPYPAYPPYYWPAPGYIAAGVLATGVAFGAGYALGRWATGGYWGGNVNWNNNNITINRPGDGNVGGNWNRGAHVEHRLGNRGGRQQGLNFRSNNSQRVLNPGGRGNLGERHQRGQNFGNRGGRQHTASRPSHGGGRHHAAARNRGPGHGANLRGHGGLNRGGGRGMHRGGGMRAHGGLRGGGGGFRGGGRGSGRGGGRRSDIRLKHHILFLERLDNGINLYRFVYNGGHTAYVGVIAQEAQPVMPAAVARGRDGYLRVFYDRLGVKFQTYDAWMASGAGLPFHQMAH